MNRPYIDPDITFTQTEAPIIVKEYVCAVCLSDLGVQEIPNEARVFVMCPMHGNVCASGRVMRSTASMQVERSGRDYFPTVAAMPDLFSPIWLSGVPMDKAKDIQRHCVCALCGSNLTTFAVMDQHSNIVDDIATLKCSMGHGNVGINGIGFVRRHEYIHVPPVEWRAFLKKRASLPQSKQFVYEPNDGASFEKIGTVSYGKRDEDTPQDHFTVTFFHGRNANQFGSAFKDPKQLRIRIPSPAVEMSLDCYNRGALTARAIRDGDGYRWEYYRDPETQEVEIRGGSARTVSGHRRQQAGVKLNEVIFTNSKKVSFALRRVARLRFVLPDLAINGQPVPGYFEMSAKDDDAEVIEKKVTEVKNKCFEIGKMLPEVSLILSMKEVDNNQIIHIEMENGVGK